MVSRDVLHELVDSLPEAEIATAERFLTPSRQKHGYNYGQLTARSPCASLKCSVRRVDVGDLSPLHGEWHGCSHLRVAIIV